MSLFETSRKILEQQRSVVAGMTLLASAAFGSQVRAQAGSDVGDVGPRGASDLSRSTFGPGSDSVSVDPQFIKDARLDFEQKLELRAGEYGSVVYYVEGDRRVPHDVVGILDPVTPVVITGYELGKSITPQEAVEQLASQIAGSIDLMMEEARKKYSDEESVKLIVYFGARGEADGYLLFGAASKTELPNTQRLLQESLGDSRSRDAARGVQRATAGSTFSAFEDVRVVVSPLDAGSFNIQNKGPEERLVVGVVQYAVAVPSQVPAHSHPEINELGERVDDLEGAFAGHFHKSPWGFETRVEAEVPLGDHPWSDVVPEYGGAVTYELSPGLDFGLFGQGTLPHHFGRTSVTGEELNTSGVRGGAELAVGVGAEGRLTLAPQAGYATRKNALAAGPNKAKDEIYRGGPFVGVRAAFEFLRREMNSLVAGVTFRASRDDVKDSTEWHRSGGVRPGESRTETNTEVGVGVTYRFR